MRKQTVICDVDEILADLITSWLGVYNRRYDQNIKKSDIKGWGIENYIKPEHKGLMYHFLDEPNLFRDLEPLPGAIESLTNIRNKGHEILICTASAKLPQIAADKLTWLKKHIPWFTQDDFFLGRKKYKIVADVLIDDAPHNIRLYREHWPKSQILTIHYPYNEDIKGLVNLYAESYTDTRSAWKQIEEYIDQLSMR